MCSRIRTRQQLANRLKYLDDLKQLQQHDLAYPVWPFSVEIRLAVLANAIVPVIPTVFGLIIDNLA